MISALAHLAAVNHARLARWYDDFIALKLPLPVEAVPTDPAASLFETVLVHKSPGAGGAPHGLLSRYARSGGDAGAVRRLSSDIMYPFAILQSAGMNGYGANVLHYVGGYSTYEVFKWFASFANATCSARLDMIETCASAVELRSSAAAGIQSGIGSVVAPSVFATLQSAGAGGYGVVAVHGAIRAAGAWFGSQGNGDEPDDSDSDNDSSDDEDGKNAPRIKA
ncbi:hypothetical protein F66182_667 [Fusarium sp. NRRL 66182]|nr:hypothetical protein F66182_667 [Fusarium sp. NRRL 66182]